MEREFLPQGDFIRQLLAKSTISNSNINTFLKDKGVFLGNDEKNNSVPFLMKSILSPEDFKNLYETQKKKEDSVKFKTATIKCGSDFKLVDVFATGVDLNKLITEEHTYKTNFKVTNDPNFYFDKDSAILEYEIERENLLEDWTNNRTIHKGAVIIQKNSSGDIELSVEQNSTSKETSTVNELIIKEVKNLLQNNGLVKATDDFIKVKFKDFSNSSRIQFLYSFTKNICTYLDFKAITDIDLFLDEDIESHKDVKMFLDEIDSLKLNGKDLLNHVLLRDAKYHNKLIVTSISLKYNFDVRGAKGSCIVVLSFPEYIQKKSLDSDLQISISFNLSREAKKVTNENKLRKELFSYIEKNKISEFPNYKN
ncbi:MAG: GapS4b family protein [Flavobacterium sp.]